MAMMHCPECGGQVSDHASSCPHCGRPVLSRGAEDHSQSLERGIACPSCQNPFWKLEAAGIRQKGRPSKVIMIVALFFAGATLIEAFVDDPRALAGAAVWLVVAFIAGRIHMSRGSYALYSCGRCGLRMRSRAGAPSGRKEPRP